MLDRIGKLETDSQGRRKRTEPQSTGKSISPTGRDMLWFEKLNEHGPLPSSFLLQYCQESHKSEKRAQERLTDLFNENNTPDNGFYLSRPPQQFRTIDSRYNSLVYDLTKPSRKALDKAGRGNKAGNVNAGPWVHRLMVSCITASIELACMGRDDINYISSSKILERTGTQLRCPVTVTDPSSGNRYEKDLLPDAIFGLEYVGDEGSKYRFFVIEADRSTEPATSSNFNRKSFLRNLLQYRAYIEGGAYRKHLGLTAPLLVLNVTTDETRTKKMIDVTASLSPQGNSYMLFQHWADFGPVFRPPGVNLDLLNGAWERAEAQNIKINQPTSALQSQK